MMWASMAACTGHILLCMWSGPAADARRDAETDEVTCPRCGARVRIWQVDQEKEMAGLRQEQAGVKASWWRQHQAREDALADLRVQSANAQMRARVAWSVTEPDRMLAEEHEHFRELMRKARP